MSGPENTESLVFVPFDTVEWSRNPVIHRNWTYINPNLVSYVKVWKRGVSLRRPLLKGQKKAQRQTIPNATVTLVRAGAQEFLVVGDELDTVAKLGRFAR